MLASVFLLVAFILFVIAGIMTVPAWNRLISFGLAAAVIGLGGLRLFGVA